MDVSPGEGGHSLLILIRFTRRVYEWRWASLRNVSSFNGVLSAIWAGAHLYTQSALKRNPPWPCSIRQAPSSMSAYRLSGGKLCSCRVIRLSSNVICHMSYGEEKVTLPPVFTVPPEINCPHVTAILIDCSHVIISILKLISCQSPLFSAPCHAYLSKISILENLN